jgi:hypothetical protein
MEIFESPSVCIYAHIFVHRACEARRCSKSLNRISKQDIANNVNDEIHDNFLPGRGLDSESLSLQTESDPK